MTQCVSTIEQYFLNKCGTINGTLSPISRNAPTRDLWRHEYYTPLLARTPRRYKNKKSNKNYFVVTCEFHGELAS